MADETKRYLINIESNLKDYTDQLVGAKKRMEEAKLAVDNLKSGTFKSRQEVELTNAAYRQAQKEYKDAQKMADLQIQANKAETNSRAQLEKILKLEMQALGKLGNAYIINAKGVRELNPLYVEQRQRIANTKQAIIEYDQALNDGRSNVGRYGESVKEAFGVGGTAINQFSSAVGGLTGTVGNLLSDFLTAGGAVGIFTAAVGLLAAAYKRTQENIELYLKSADKVKFGYAGFSKDAKAALIETRRRASGQIATGMEARTRAQYQFNQPSTTAEEKEKLKIQVEQAALMIKEGQALLDQVTGEENKVKWSLKYNELDQERGKLEDERLAKETEWQALERDLKEQRDIATDQDATALEISNAKVKSEEIATKLGNEKLALLDREIKNLTEIGKQTGTEEALEDQIFALEKEKKTVQTEYFDDQIKINKLEKASTKDLEAQAKALRDKNKEMDAYYTKVHDEAEKQRQDALKEFGKSQADKSKNIQSGLLGQTDSIKLSEADQYRKKDMQALSELNKLRNKYNADALQENLDNEWKAYKQSAEYFDLTTNQKLLAEQNYTDATTALSQLRIEQQLNEVNAMGNVAGAISNLLGKQSAVGKGFAVAEAIMNTYSGATLALTDKTIPSTALRIAAAAAVVINGLANVRQILAVNTGGGSSSGPRSISPATSVHKVAPPTNQGANIFNQSSNNQVAQTVQNQNTLTAKDIAKELALVIPNKISVEDINQRIKEKLKVETRAKI